MSNRHFAQVFATHDLPTLRTKGWWIGLPFAILDRCQIDCATCRGQRDRFQLSTRFRPGSLIR